MTNQNAEISCESSVDERMPKHIAIIMDGNGRWAGKKHLPRVEGHRQGADRIREILKACKELHVPYLTLYAFSKENWARPKEEVNFLMALLSNYMDTELKELQRAKIRFQMIGRLEELPVDVQKKIKRNIENTKNNTAMTLTLALSYSGRDEILDGVRKIVQQVQNHTLTPEEINERLFSDSLYTKGTPDPDLLIRTSGELRLSNFLLWQLSYTEIYVTEKLWPDFGKEDLIRAIEVYKIRDRRFGKVHDTASKNHVPV